ncbi:hypothetical protein [Paenibacillus sp. HJGM_3]|uniref:hypothetical protein n=1 Tax=Paenibacillus sp. HJGM_3 TaxID=3379816 RepID=UPI00385C7CC6
MKATINGIQVEGTPQEIAEFQRMQNERIAMKPYTNPYGPAVTPYWEVHPYPGIIPRKWVEVTCGSDSTTTTTN